MILKNWCLAADGAGSGGGAGDGGSTGGGTGAGDGAGASGTPPDWRASLPENLKTEPSLADVPDVGTLAKRFVDAHKFIGLKRLEAPTQSWDEKKWGEFYTALGRPEAPDKYKVPEVKVPEGMEVSEDAIKAARENLHKLGLTQKQFEGALQWYLGFESEQFKKTTAEVESGRATAEAKLKEEWGDKFAQNADIARAALKKFSSPDFAKWVDESGVGNNPELVKVFHQIGMSMLEDTARGKGPGLPLNDSTAAAMELANLKLDTEFMKALTKREHIGHRTAVARWTQLHERAYPGKQPEQSA